MKPSKTRKGELDMTIGNRIAMLRRQRGLKQEELAQMLRVSPQAVSKWENDQSCPDISLLPRLAAILGISVDELLSGKALAPAVSMVPKEARKEVKDMMLRVVVDSSDGDKVRVNLPLALVQAAVDMGLDIVQMPGSDALKRINLEQILELVRQGAIGNLVEIESEDGDTVRIFVE